MLKKFDYLYYYGTEMIEEQGNMFCAYCLTEIEDVLEDDGLGQYIKNYSCDCKQAKAEEELKRLMEKQVKQYNLIIDNLLAYKGENIKQLKYHWDEIDKERVSIIREMKNLKSKKL